jgi:hypothetical protein
MFPYNEELFCLTIVDIVYMQLLANDIRLSCYRVRIFAIEPDKLHMRGGCTLAWEAFIGEPRTLFASFLPYD